MEGSSKGFAVIHADTARSLVSRTRDVPDKAPSRTKSGTEQKATDQPERLERTSKTHPIPLSWVIDPDASTSGRVGLCYCPGKQVTRNGERWQRDMQADLGRLRDVFQACANPFSNRTRRRVPHINWCLSLSFSDTELSVATFIDML